MRSYLSKSILLLLWMVLIVCIIYPFTLWVIGQVFFPFQANGSLLIGSNGKPVGSRLIAQSFTKKEYFHPRPSSASYDASASSSSSLAASNYALRDRVARSLGPVVKYKKGHQLVGLDIETWFSQDKYQGHPNIVGQWATLHPALAKAWVSADPMNSRYVDHWIKTHPNIKISKATNLAVSFFQSFSKENPGKFPVSVSNQKGQKQIELTHKGIEIQSIFFDMWRQDHPNAELIDLPGDKVTTSASGLDPHITFQNATHQLERVANQWASLLKRNPDEIRKEIEQLLQENAQAPFWGLAGERLINVLEVNLELNKRYQLSSLKP